MTAKRRPPGRSWAGVALGGLSLVGLSLAGAWVAATWSTYRHFGIWYPVWGESAPVLAAIARLEKAHLVRSARVHIGFGRNAVRDSGLRTVELALPDASLERLESRIPASSRQWVPGTVHTSSGPLGVRVKYRGDFAWHWITRKRSLRIATRKPDLFLGLPAVNLNSPKFGAQIQNLLGYRLAIAFGLLAPAAEMVELRVNGRSRGLHLLVEQISESTLRRNGRLPGDIYRGEVVAREAYHGIRNDLFLHPGLWDKVAFDGNRPKKATTPLVELIERIRDLRSGDPEAPDLAERLEPGLWGRYLAFEVLGQVLHADGAHNWRLYFDPSRRTFEPVVWDPNAWHPRAVGPAGGEPRLDIAVGPLHDLLLSDQRFLLARYRALYRFFEEGRDREFLREVERAATAVGVAVDGDPSPAGAAQLSARSPAEVRRDLQDLSGAIRHTFDRVRTAYLETPASVRAQVDPDDPSIRLQVSSRCPVSEVALTLEAPVPTARARLEVETLRGTVGVPLDASELRSDGAEIELRRPLLSSLSRRSETAGTFEGRLEPVPVTYRLRLPGLGRSARLLGGRARCEGHAEVEALIVGPPVAGSPARVERALPASSPPETLVWSGSKLLEGRTDIQSDLFVRAGTTLRLAPGAVLWVRGRLVLDGTAAEPVRIERAGEAPWGAVVVDGPGANGSMLRHCQVGGGSGFVSRIERISGMVSFLHVEGAVVAGCRFESNSDFDDLVHVVGGSIHFENSSFLDANADALDLDLTRATIRDCRFERAGNDAVDLMDSRVAVRDVTIRHADDKGFSVGESSVLVASAVDVAESAIGLQSKDLSHAFVRRSRFDRNRVAFSGFRKNRRYDGPGAILVDEVGMADNGSVADLRDGATLSVHRPPADSGLPFPLLPEISVSAEAPVLPPLPPPSWSRRW